jgi:predicted permease
LSFPDLDRLAELWESQFPGGYRENEASPANYRDWKRMSKAFEGIAAFRGLSVDMVGTGDPEQLNGASATADLFPMLGAHAALGRIFTPEDDRPGVQGTAVLSYGFWQRRFGGDPNVLGHKVILDSEPYVIIGVMPKDFYFPNRACQLWTPMRFVNADFQDRTNTYLHVIAKLRDGVTLWQAQADMWIVANELQREYPKDNARISVLVQLLRDGVLERSPGMLLIALLGASLCVLLIACTNLANLLLARALVRRKELAVRTAMGAGREQLVRQMLTESSVLAIFGGALGVLLAVGVAPLLGKLVPVMLPVAQTPNIDLRMLSFALLVTAVTAIGFGVLPALRVCKGVDVRHLHEGSRGGVGGRRERLRSTLVVVLLISAGLLIRARLRIQETDPGFRSGRLLTMRTSLPMPKYEKTATRAAFYSSVISGLTQLPGVKDAAYTSFLPMVMRGGVWPVTIEGQPRRDGDFRHASMRFVTPKFFSTLGIPLLMGRAVSESDTLDKPLTAVVSESFVQQYWPHENPLDRKFEIAESMRTVTGVVGNVRVRGLERSSEPQVYLPYRQVPDIVTASGSLHDPSQFPGHRTDRP